jgi:hypothetical protein
LFVSKSMFPTGFKVLPWRPCVSIFYFQRFSLFLCGFFNKELIKT